MRLVRFLVSPRLQVKGKMVLIAVDAVPVGSKPPAAVRVRISAGERYFFGTTSQLSTRASYLVQGRAGGPVESSPKLVKTHRIGIDLLGRRIIPTYYSLCCNVLHTPASLVNATCAFMARSGYRASYSRLAERCLVSLIFSVNSSK